MTVKAGENAEATGDFRRRNCHAKVRVTAGRPIRDVTTAGMTRMTVGSTNQRVNKASNVHAAAACKGCSQFYLRVPTQFPLILKVVFS